VLNGSGLNQLETITRELQRALGGEGGAVGELLPKLDTFVSGLDAQRGDIVKALDGLNRLSAQLAGQNQVIADAVDQLGPALQVLDREREDLTRTLRSLGRLGDTTTQVIDASRDDLLANLNNLQPVLKSVADADKSVVESLKLFGTFPFPAFTAPNACRGDFCNLRVTVDLTLDSLDADLLTGTPLQGSLLAVQNILGGRAPGAAGDAGDPLRGPLGLPTPDLVAPAPADTAPPAAPAAPRAGDATPAPAPAPDRPDQGQGGLLGGIFGGER
jgi:phospholipid/cholesterol/gamma-HCH transport system substrate-binding protein